MTNPYNLLIQLKTQGAKITKVRKTLANVLCQHPLPLSEIELRKLFNSNKVKVNKTTIYRELEFLKAKGLVREINFGDGIKRFELNLGHHHHLICNNCRRVDEVETNDDLQKLEQKISRSKKFFVANHSLEFFGLCQNCQN